jgi:hypothetical protein
MPLLFRYFQTVFSGCLHKITCVSNQANAIENEFPQQIDFNNHNTTNANIEWLTLLFTF